MAPPQLSPGDRLGPWSIVAPIARGSMSEVHRASDASGRMVALKVPRRPAFVRHLRREGVLLAQVSHPNVARVIDVSEDLKRDPDVAPPTSDEQPWIAVELVEGQPLRALCRGTIPPSEATLLADQILAGLSAIHRAGILHLDLKPENVIVQPDGVAKIVDLGLGKAMSAFMAEVFLSASLASRDLPLAGTLAYMAPEQRRGKAVDARADLFAFGVLLHELLSARLPDPNTRLTRLREELTPRWDVAIARLTHPELEMRPASADEARQLVAFTLAEKSTVPVAPGGVDPRDLSVWDEEALQHLSPWVAGMVVGGCELIAPLGRGGYGEVWRARRGDDFVAVKLALKDEARAGLAIEAAAAARIVHPGVPRVLDDRTGEDPPCIVFELIEGQSLRLLVNEEGKLPVRDALGLFGGMVELVQACHVAEVVHGDIKPEHFIRGSDRMWLIDFGLARLVGEPALAGSLASRPGGDVRGTYDYMAPELRAGKGGEAADVYALGVCLFEMLADYLPRGPQRLKALRPEVPDEIDALALAMMSERPGDRPHLVQVLAVLRTDRLMLGGAARRRTSSSSAATVVLGVVLLLLLPWLVLRTLRSPVRIPSGATPPWPAHRSLGPARPLPTLPVDRVAASYGLLGTQQREALAALVRELESQRGIRLAILVDPGELSRETPQERARRALESWGMQLVLCCDPLERRLGLAALDAVRADELTGLVAVAERRMRAAEPGAGFSHLVPCVEELVLALGGTAPTTTTTPEAEGR